ncbi:MAG: hypothetical protein ACJAYH_001079 [Celeribacter sp.]
MVDFAFDGTWAFNLDSAFQMRLGAVMAFLKPFHVPLPKRTLWQHLKALNARIEDSWIGDLIGVACLFAMLFASPWALALFLS